MTSFLDSNVLLYLAVPTMSKSEKADKLVEAGGVISVQVLNEYAQVARKKLRIGMPNILEALATFRDLLEVVPLTLETHERAMQIASISNLSIHDCNIVAAADLAGCKVLYSEDMNHGQRIGGVTIRNPFKGD